MKLKLILAVVLSLFIVGGIPSPASSLSANDSPDPLRCCIWD